MTTSIYGAFLPHVPKSSLLVPISKGGTGAATAKEAAANLNIITKDMENVPGGVVRLGSSGTLDNINLNAFNVHLIGPTSVTVNSVNKIWISDFDDFSTYTVSATMGSVKRTKDYIEFAAPAIAGTVIITVNDKIISINVTEGDTRPLITDGNISPVNKSCYFGYSTVLSKDNQTLVVSAPKEDIDGVSMEGAIYVYKKQTTGWLEIQKLVPKEKNNLDTAGWSLAVSFDGSVIAAGSQNNNTDSIGDNIINNCGAVWIFEKNDKGVYVEKQKLVAEDRSVEPYYGYSVSLSSDGKFLVVGAYANSLDSTLLASTFKDKAGSAYIYGRTGIGWGFKQKITADDRHEKANFGEVVLMSSDSTYIFVGSGSNRLNSAGAELHLNNDATQAKLTKAGAVYVFKYNSSNGKWEQEVKLLSPEIDDVAFGTSLAIGPSSGANKDTILVIGANSSNTDDNSSNSRTQAGAAYVLKRTGANWGVTDFKKLVANDRNKHKRFGTEVAISGDGNVIAIHSDDNPFTTETAVNLEFLGSIHVFKFSTVWELKGKVVNAVRTKGDSYGNSLALSTDGVDMVVGCPGKDRTEGTDTWDQGMVYLVNNKLMLSTAAASPPSEVTGGSTTPNQQYHFYPDLSNATDSFNNYGFLIAMSGDGKHVLLLSTGSNPPTGLMGISVFYIYKNSAGNWVDTDASGKQIVLKNMITDLGNIGYDNPEINDDGTMAVWGVSYFCYDATGSNYKEYSGMTVLLERDPTSTTWVLTRKFLPNVREDGDRFGHQVAVSDDWKVMAISDINGVIKTYTTDSTVFDSTITSELKLADTATFKEVLGLELFDNGQILACYLSDAKGNCTIKYFKYASGSSSWTSHWDANTMQYSGFRTVSSNKKTHFSIGPVIVPAGKSASGLDQYKELVSIMHVDIANKVHSEIAVLNDNLNTTRQEDEFGNFVAIGGTRYLISARREHTDENGKYSVTDAGAAYLYDQTDTSKVLKIVSKFSKNSFWDPVAKRQKASGTFSGGGVAISKDGTKAAITAPLMPVTYNDANADKVVGVVTIIDNLFIDTTSTPVLNSNDTKFGNRFRVYGASGNTFYDSGNDVYKYGMIVTAHDDTIQPNTGGPSITAVAADHKEKVTVFSGEDGDVIFANSVIKNTVQTGLSGISRDRRVLYIHNLSTGKLERWEDSGTVTAGSGGGSYTLNYSYNQPNILDTPLTTVGTSLGNSEAWGINPKLYGIQVSGDGSRVAYITKNYTISVNKSVSGAGLDEYTVIDPLDNMTGFNAGSITGFFWPRVSKKFFFVSTIEIDGCHVYVFSDDGAGYKFKQRLLTSYPLTAAEQLTIINEIGPLPCQFNSAWSCDANGDGSIIVISDPWYFDGPNANKHRLSQPTVANDAARKGRVVMYVTTDSWSNASVVTNHKALDNTKYAKTGVAVAISADGLTLAVKSDDELSVYSISISSNTMPTCVELLNVSLTTDADFDLTNDGKGVVITYGNQINMYTR